MARPTVLLADLLRKPARRTQRRLLGRDAVAHVKAHPNAEGGMAPIYGLATTIPDRSVVHDLLKSFMDLSYNLCPPLTLFATRSHNHL